VWVSLSYINSADFFIFSLFLLHGRLIESPRPPKSSPLPYRRTFLLNASPSELELLCRLPLKLPAYKFHCSLFFKHSKLLLLWRVPWYYRNPFLRSSYKVGFFYLSLKRNGPAECLLLSSARDSSLLNDPKCTITSMVGFLPPSTCSSFVKIGTVTEDNSFPLHSFPSPSRFCPSPPVSSSRHAARPSSHLFSRFCGDSHSLCLPQ